MASKKFEYGQGIYYFNIRNGGQSSITIKRTKKNEAVDRFHSYKALGKEVEWLGKWEGKKFTDSAMPAKTR